MAAPQQEWQSIGRFYGPRRLIMTWDNYGSGLIVALFFGLWFFVLPRFGFG
jgi:hypothetical protein